MVKVARSDFFPVTYTAETDATFDGVCHLCGIAVTFGGHSPVEREVIKVYSDRRSRRFS